MMIDNLLEMEIKDLNNYILDGCSREERIKILKDDRIREKYLDFGMHNYVLFAFLLIGLNDDVKYMLDDDCLDVIFKDDYYVEDKLRCIIVCYPEFINMYSGDVRIIEAIVNSKKLIKHVNKFDSRFGKNFFDYIVKNDMIDKYLLLSDEVQTELLEDKNNRDLLKEINVSDLFISSLSKQSIDNLKIDDYFVNRIVNMTIAMIDNIVRKGVSIPIVDAIIDKYISVNNINLYRVYMENLNIENSNLVDIIESKRKKKYDLIFDNVSSDGLLMEYKKIYSAIVNGEEVDTEYVDLVMGFYGDYNNIFNYLYNETSNRLLDVLIDRYFEEIPYNFMMNLEMMLNFISSVDEEVIDIDNLKLYKKIYEFSELSISEKISLYNDMNNGINYMQVFYDDYRKCRDYAYSLYNDKVLKLDKMIKSDLSSKYDVDVYELNGEDFTAYVHQTRCNREDDSIEGIWEYDDNFKDGVTLSLSMINENHVETIYGLESFVCFGFSNLDIDRIMHVYHTDSFTKDFKSDRVNEILTSDYLMKKTEGYNEILYLEDNLSMKYGNKKYEKLMPSYVLCYNKITMLEIDIAKKFNIPIVLLHGDKYVNKKYFHSSEDKIYLTGYEKKGTRR